VAETPCQIHPTPSFYRDVDLLREELGPGADAVLKSLGDAVDALAAAPADPPVEAHGWIGDTFAYPLANGFVLTFRRTTDRDERKKPKLIHLYLKRVMRSG
jgi:hypothetical protein